MKRTAVSLLTSLVLAVPGVVIGAASPAAAVSPPVDLYAVSGSTTLPDGVSLPVYGYALAAGASVTQPGGPLIEANEGDVVTITVHNELGEPTGLRVQGQTLALDEDGADAGGSSTYEFTAGHAGTYLYEASPVLTGRPAGADNTQHQAAMGLHGALVVHPATAGQAYGDASSAYDTEQVLLLSEIDPALNNSVTPASFDMRKWKPKYFLINGKAHPATDAITAPGGQDVLLRYVNAGVDYHSMAVLGARQRLIALDGSPLADERDYTAETIGPGQTADTIVTTPVTDGDVALSVYDASLLLHNSNSGGSGGMYTSLSSTNSPAGADTVGPLSSNVGYTGGQLTASVTDAGRGGSTVDGIEYYIDGPTTPGLGAPVAGTFTPAGDTVAFDEAVTIPLGEVTLYVRGHDAAGNWGPFSSVLVNGGDPGGPTTSGLVLTPEVTNHGGAGNSVAISATGDDTDTGNNDVTEFEYTIIGADPALDAVVVTVDSPAPVASLDAAIPAAVVNVLDAGTYQVSVRSADAGGNWGAPVEAPLTIDLEGPAVATGADLSIKPSPNNGRLPVNASLPFVRVTASSISDPGTVAGAEIFVGTVPVNPDGKGVPMSAADGVWNSTLERGYADIPLPTVRQLTEGDHLVHVHARDAAGNWGPMQTVTLVVDKTRPVMGAISFSSSNNGSPTVAITGTAADGAGPVQTGIAMFEWFTGPNPGAGKGTPLTAATGCTPAGSCSISSPLDVTGLSEGSYVIKVRARDLAGNWSTTSRRTLNVTTPLYYSVTGNQNPPGVGGGGGDDADIYRWTGTQHQRYINMGSNPNGVPGNADVDAYTRVDATHYYASFKSNVNLPGLGTVADEDVVFRDGSVWRLAFDGSAHGITGDVGAMSINGNTLYLSLNGNATLPGVVGAGDNADIYRWNGVVTTTGGGTDPATGPAYTRVFNAAGPTVGGLAAAGLQGGANVDALDVVDATHLYLSFSGSTTTVPGLGLVRDEEVVLRNGKIWSLYFDGTTHGLTGGGLDVDAIDVQ